MLFKNISRLLFRRRTKKWELVCLCVHINNQAVFLQQYQEQGWEICGDVLVKNKSGHIGDTYLLIPFRRRTSG